MQAGQNAVAVTNAHTKLTAIRDKAETLAQGITDVYDKETAYSRLTDKQSDWDESWKTRLEDYRKKNGW